MAYSRKANQKPRNERTGTRLGRDIDSVSQKSRFKVNRVTSLRSHETLPRLWLLLFASMMESDSKFEQSYQSDDFYVSNLEIIGRKKL